MAKSFTFQDMTKPASITGTVVADGTLVANTTYYYRVIGVREAGNNSSYWVGKTKSSDLFSATTTTINKSVQISFTMPAGEGVLSYRIFRFTTPTGMLNNNTGCIKFFPKDVTYRSGTTITFIDTGYANYGGNTYLNIDTDPHGVLTATNSTSIDTLSIVDVYNADVANGWGVVQRIDSQTYFVNCYLSIIGQYWTDNRKTIIFADGFNYTNVVANLGLKSGANQTSGTMIIKETQMWLSAWVFTTLNAYRTHFLYVFPAGLELGLGLSGLSFNNGLVQDCSAELGRYFQPTNAATCIIKNFTYNGYDVAFFTGDALFLNVRLLKGSRVWQFSTQTVNGKGVFIDGAYAALLSGGAGTLNTVDSQFVNSFMISASATGTVLNDKISYNLNVVDSSQVAIASANVKIYDKDNTLVVNINTDSNGNITEQEITRRQFTVIGTVVQPVVNKYPFTLIISKTGYETYTELVTYLLSLPVVKTVALKPIIKTRKTLEGRILKVQLPELGSSAKLLEL